MLESLKQLFSARGLAAPDDDINCRRILEAIEAHDVVATKALIQDHPDLLNSDYGGGGMDACSRTCGTDSEWFRCCWARDATSTPL